MDALGRGTRHLVVDTHKRMAWCAHVVVDTHLVAIKWMAWCSHVVVVMDNLASLVVGLGSSLDIQVVTAQDTVVANQLVDMVDTLVAAMVVRPLGNSLGVLVVTMVVTRDVAVEVATHMLDASYATGVAIKVI